MRIAVFLDGANFFYMQKDRLRWWIDPKKFLNLLRQKGEIIHAFYYIGVGGDTDPQQENYLKALTYMGYALVEKQIKFFTDDDGNERRKANLDVDIVMDMFNLIDTYDHAVLISGDMDFERSLDALRNRGKSFSVYSTQGFVARDIRKVAGSHFVDFQDIRKEVEKAQ